MHILNMTQPTWAIRGVTSALFAIVVLTLLWRPANLFLSATPSNQQHFPNGQITLLPDQQKQFWRNVYHDLTESRPNCSKIEHHEGLNVVSLKEPPPPRPVKVLLSDQQHKALKVAHKDYTVRLNSRSYKLPYLPSTRGIVITAGDSYLIHALVTIRMLRRTGTELPIEVYLRDNSEGDPRICSAIFPSLNAKCIPLSDTLGEDITKIGKYQYKMIAMLLSTFEEFLYLDADCFPIYNPDILFTKPPFTTHGLVLWPDFWYPTESPYFFDIANIAMPPMDQRQVASEAGTILYSKKTHELPLLLAAYYNFYGPDFYYKLHSQGALGEGDKETFRWSAIAGNSTFYQVATRVDHLGFVAKDGEERYNTMAQFDPIADFASTTHMNPKSPPPVARPFFMHAHNPKLDPGWMFGSERKSTIFDSDGSMRRMWHENSTQAREYFASGSRRGKLGFGKDPEMGMWMEMRDMACEYGGLFSEEVCTVGREFVGRVFGEGG